MLISFAPNVAKATKLALMFWAWVTHGAESFTPVDSCALSENQNRPCVSVSCTHTLGKNAGITYRFGAQYIILLDDPNDYYVTIHEIGHVVLGMGYHAAPFTSLMSPSEGAVCLTDEDAREYKKTHPYGTLTPDCMP